MALKGKQIVLGVTGGIAAYKSAELVRLLVKKGACVNVVMTKHACQFITPLTMQTLSKNPVGVEMFDYQQRTEIEHIGLADKADILIIAPASANVIGKIANGIADDLLSTVVMATKAPILIAPSMNSNMYGNPIVQQNMKKLKVLGYHFADPDSGELACGYKGVGRLTDLEKIIAQTEKLLK